MEIKYAILNPHAISNLCGPERIPVGWTPLRIKQRTEATEETINRKNKINNFYNELEANVLANGFINPILVSVGIFSNGYLNNLTGTKVNSVRGLIHRIHPDLREDPEHIITCEQYGGSRLWVAQKHNLNIPCIISDFVDHFEGIEILESKEAVLNKFVDTPSELTINELGVSMAGWERSEDNKEYTTGYKVKYAVLPSNMITNNLEPDESRQQILEDENQFFTKLEKSILKEGFRNPIVITALKDEITNRYGGSRLMIAQKHNMNIPCIIADFAEVFPAAKEIHINDIKKYYKDEPMFLYLQPHGINISGCKNTHLEEDDV